MWKNIGWLSLLFDIEGCSAFWNEPDRLSSRQEARVVSVSNETVGSNDAAASSADGRHVAFVRFSTDPEALGTRRRSDIHWHDVVKGDTRLISTSHGGERANGNSGTPILSGDGRFIAFESQASNLVPGDENNQPDIFVLERETDRITIVSADSDGRQANGDSFDPWINRNGRFVVFASDASNLVQDDSNQRMDVFVHDRKTGATSLISRSTNGIESNGDSYGPSISTDGRMVAFQSLAFNLVPDDTNGKADVFVHDRQSGKTTRVSVSSDGKEGNDHSVAPFVGGKGRRIVFQSYATNLVKGDTNGHPDIFLHDLTTRTTRKISVAHDGRQANGASYFPSLSDDGRYIVFYSLASNLVPGDTNGKSDIFVMDLKKGFVRRVSVGWDGSEADGGSYSPVIGGEGRSVVFTSNATNLTRHPGSTGTNVFIAFLP